MLTDRHPLRQNFLCVLLSEKHHRQFCHSWVRDRKAMVWVQACLPAAPRAGAHWWTRSPCSIPPALPCRRPRHWAASSAHLLQLSTGHWLRVTPLLLLNLSSRSPPGEASFRATLQGAASYHLLWPYTTHLCNHGAASAPCPLEQQTHLVFPEQVWYGAPAPCWAPDMDNASGGASWASQMRLTPRVWGPEAETSAQPSLGPARDLSSSAEFQPLRGMARDPSPSPARAPLVLPNT